MITWPAPWTSAGESDLLEFGKHFFAMAQKLLDEGKIPGHPRMVVDGGLHTVLEGMDLVKSGAVSDQKLVAKVS